MCSTRAAGDRDGRLASGPLPPPRHWHSLLPLLILRLGVRWLEQISPGFLLALNYTDVVDHAAGETFCRIKPETKGVAALGPAGSAGGRLPVVTTWCPPGHRYENQGVADEEPAARAIAVES